MLASVDTIPNAVTTFRQKFFLGSAPAELVRMVFRLSSARSARQFEGFVYVDGQLGREPGRYQVPLRGKLEVFLNGGFVALTEYTW